MLLIVACRAEPVKKELLSLKPLSVAGAGSDAIESAVTGAGVFSDGVLVLAADVSVVDDAAGVATAGLAAAGAGVGFG